MTWDELSLVCATAVEIVKPNNRLDRKIALNGEVQFFAREGAESNGLT
jgi:hypothetical protein